MKVNQIYEILNTITGELLGESAVVKEDLSNAVELGEQFENVVGLDKYVRALTDKIGKMIFVDRVYKGRAPSVYMDGWEFGSIVEKVTAELPSASENESWELEDGTSYDTNIFYKPKVSAKCWNNRVTFEIPMSFAEIQVKSSFSNAEQMNAFYSMIYVTIQNSLTMKLDALIMRTINNFIGETIFDDYGAAAISSKSGVKAVNLLYLYNNGPNAGNPAITAAAAMTDADFLRFASATIKNYGDRMSTMSRLFNVGKKERFTPRDRMKLVMLSEFRNAADVYLYGGQSEFRAAEYAKLPDADSVAYWQGSGEDFQFGSTSTINVRTSGNHDVNVSGVLAVMFDRDALGVTNQNPRVKTHYIEKAEFFNEWHKFDAGYFNDLNENGVVFFAA